ncbi:MBL fold metallo-hydrolase [Bradyrhizobium sp. HKCCYLS1011]|uniref:MBL fold metallo-hydrolase n=1 Tax=Bradyrhizobium sp. HKCCYLS1011 TaxID=3420733 RepID=UPI003EBF94AB
MNQIPLPETAEAENRAADEARDDGVREIAPDVGYRQLAIVNVVFYGPPAAGDGNWVLIDTGVFASGPAIRHAAHARFGGNGKPACIIQTHGHFDHVGLLETLSSEWNVPVYAHPLELPYLNGTHSYPPADPEVGGGLLALLSPMFPTRPVDVSSRLHSLPDDHSVPFMPEFRWLHTPGHAPGHISLWRERDRLLIAGDAVVTTAQESVYAAVMQKPEMHGPPMYFTPDWAAARESVRALAALSPETVITGHGAAMRGPEMRKALDQLARDFDDIAVPKAGRHAPS